MRADLILRRQPPRAVIYIRASLMAMSRPLTLRYADAAIQRMATRACRDAGAGSSSIRHCGGIVAAFRLYLTAVAAAVA